MENVKEIAQWFVLRAADDVNRGGEYLTKLKLQKLLYYAQGFYYAFFNKKLFEDKIIHMPYGPAVKTLLDDLKDIGNEPIESLKVKISDFNDDVFAILNLVYDKLAQYSAFKLVEMTHSEDPWRNTHQGEEIKVTDISKYFKKHYIKD